LEKAQETEETEAKHEAISALWTYVLGSPEFEEKGLMEFFARPEWWIYDPFECAGLLGLDVPDLCEDWRLIHFVIAREHVHYVNDSNVAPCERMRLPAMVKAEERLVGIAFRGRHCWQEARRSAVNVLMYPHKLPL